MDFATFDEFWKALGRLYDDILEMKESIREQRESNQELRGSVEELGGATARLLTIVESHERRLDRAEITVEAILEDLRRHREGRSPQ
jgi:hypothetical protein